MPNTNLGQAKKVKNDEFYTQLPDIEKELQHYQAHFKDKIVYCNCDDHRLSNFYRYFSLNFEYLGLKKLITTHFNREGVSYKLEILRGGSVVETPLRQNGDFRSDEAIELLKEADIVVTNPPFSLFREFIDLLMKHEKLFLVIGSQNAITYKECFGYIKNNKMWLGNTSPKEFVQPDGTVKAFGNISWFTNLTHSKRNEELILYRQYNETDYPKYDNYDAINVDKVKDIPADYMKVIGVPITFLDKFNPEQFEIVGIDRVLMEELTGKVSRFWLNGKENYARVLIKRRQDNSLFM